MNRKTFIKSAIAGGLSSLGVGCSLEKELDDDDESTIPLDLILDRPEIPQEIGVWDAIIVMEKYFEEEFTNLLDKSIQAALQEGYLKSKEDILVRDSNE